MKALEPCPRCGMAPLPGCIPDAQDQWGMAQCAQFTLSLRRRAIQERWPVFPRFAGATLADCPDNAAKLWAWVEAVREEKSSAPSIVICGPVGVGKTHLACAALAEARLKGLLALQTDATDLLRRIRESFRPEAAELTSDIEGDLREAQVLLVDDIGKQRSTDFADETLFGVFGHRYAHGKPTVVTSNLNEAQLTRNETWRAIIDRLLDGGIVIRMTGKSRRRPISAVKAADPCIGISESRPGIGISESRS